MRPPLFSSMPLRGGWKGLVVALSAGGLMAQGVIPPGGASSFRNTALGENALSSIDLSGDFFSRAPESAMNVAVGYAALVSTTTGYRNVALGAFALGANRTGHGNVAVGMSALGANVDGSENTAIGDQGLLGLRAGSGNIAIGSHAGAWLSRGSDNLYLGSTSVSSEGTNLEESGTIRIGDVEGRHRALFLGGVQDGNSAGTWPLAIQKDGRVVRLTSLPEIQGGTPVVVDAEGHWGRAPRGTDVSEPDGKSAGMPTGMVSGSILLLRRGSPPPPGFTRLGVLRPDNRAVGSGATDPSMDLYVKQ